MMNKDVPKEILGHFFVIRVVFFVTVPGGHVRETRKAADVILERTRKYERTCKCRRDFW